MEVFYNLQRLYQALPVIGVRTSSNGRRVVLTSRVCFFSEPPYPDPNHASKTCWGGFLIPL